MEEEGVVMPPPPVQVVDEEVVYPPPVVVVEEEEAVQQPPLVEEEEVVVQPPPLVEEEEVAVVQPPPLVEEEEGMQPPPLMEEEEGVQPPPMVEEGEEGVQEDPAPDPHALHQLAQWRAMRLRYAAHYRRRVATELEKYVIPRCRRARVTLLEVSVVLLQEQEPIEAAETIYTDLLEDVSRGMNPLLIGPAANFVDSLFNWPGPLAAFTDAARALVHDTFYNPPPEGGPLQEASRELRYLVHVAHAGAAYHFWAGNHDQADAQARRALQRLNFAVERSLAADHAVGLCGIMPASRVRPGAGPHMPTAALRLQQTIDAVDDVLVELLDMQDTLMLVEQAVLNITGGQHPPPP